jgi:hypothetical protein
MSPLLYQLSYTATTFTCRFYGPIESVCVPCPSVFRQGRILWQDPQDGERLIPWVGFPPFPPALENVDCFLR